jgi:kinesin family protein 2/24
LRYADRVKELGAEDPALQKASPTENGLLLDEDSMRSEDGVLSPEDSDLAQLRSLNDTELSADWYNFQVRNRKNRYFDKKKAFFPLEKGDFLPTLLSLT